jgi:hypothetical protein
MATSTRAHFLRCPQTGDRIELPTDFVEVAFLIVVVFPDGRKLARHVATAEGFGDYLASYNRQYNLAGNGPYAVAMPLELALVDSDFERRRDAAHYARRVAASKGGAV